MDPDQKPKEYQSRRKRKPCKRTVMPSWEDFDNEHLFGCLSGSLPSEGYAITSSSPTQRQDGTGKLKPTGFSAKVDDNVEFAEISVEKKETESDESKAEDTPSYSLSMLDDEECQQSESTFSACGDPLHDGVGWKHLTPSVSYKTNISPNTCNSGTGTQDIGQPFYCNMNLGADSDEINKVCESVSKDDAHGGTNSDRKPLVCPVCQCHFKEALPLKHHMLTHSAEKPFFCTNCDFRCRNASNLRKHMLTHLTEKRFSCDQCSYSCTRSDYLKKHKRKHSGSLPYACGECGRGYFNRTDLTQHMFTHSGERLFSCDSCQFTTNRKTGLKNHVIAKHTESDTKPFQCGLCNYGTSTAQNMARHMNIHAGLKPYACPRCEYRCSDKSSLCRHVTARHPDAKIPCQHCSYKACIPEDLVKHMKRHPHATLELEHSVC